jgi:phage terminase large subunit-like protein
MKNINISFRSAWCFRAEAEETEKAEWEEETVMAIIRMRDHLYDEIVNYAKEHLPEEACGLLAGSGNRRGKRDPEGVFSGK